MPAKDHMLSAICEHAATRPAPSGPLAQAGLLALSERIWQST
jgi:hypothetical protein